MKDADVASLRSSQAVIVNPQWYAFPDLDTGPDLVELAGKDLPLDVLAGEAEFGGLAEVSAADTYLNTCAPLCAGGHQRTHHGSHLWQRSLAGSDHGEHYEQNDKCTPASPSANPLMPPHCS